jgi:hypothetical protein
MESPTQEFNSEELHFFYTEGRRLSVSFVETQQVTTGVTAHIYDFDSTKEKDLAIVVIQAGCSTPLQMVNSGVKTTEGWISGKGTLTINKGLQDETVFYFPKGFTNIVEISVGQTMQWKAETIMVISEVCTPPYETGRFTDLD